MKRVFAVAMTIILLFVYCFTSADKITASSPGLTEIYKEGSTGEMVVRIQIRLRELGYFNFKATGAYRGMTVDSAKQFQLRYHEQGEDIFVDGRMGEQSINRLFSSSALRANIPDSVHMPKGPTEPSASQTGEILAWQEVKGMLTEAQSYRVTDCYTGSSFLVSYSGGENHAEVETTSTEETAKFMTICGSDYNFLKRPVVVNIDGREIAASIQCYPHGSDSISQNDMAGHVCLYFDGSLSHVGGFPDIEHNFNISIASGRSN